jgi:hypothetical protein
MGRLVAGKHNASPCTEALVNAQVAQVLVGNLNSYPKVDGKGGEYLRQYGIEVSAGDLEEIIKVDLKEFSERVKSGKQGIDDRSSKKPRGVPCGFFFPIASFCGGVKE